MASYTLYHFPYSICSIMVRYTLALRGPPKSSSDEMTVEERVLNIMEHEQITEEYLCELNPKGQVPVLASPALRAPLTDSLAITHYVMEHYPSLAPEQHKERIQDLLRKLHGINYFSLTYTGKDFIPRGANKKIEGMLAQGGLSERYEKALRNKIKVNEDEKIASLKDGVPEHNHELARALLAECEGLLSDEGPWLFGLDKPTAMDAHLVPFVARLLDVQRADAVPARVKEYAEKAKAGREWESLMEGRSTLMH